MTPQLLGQLIDDHAAALTLFARQWCAAPEDVVQEAFVKLSAQRPLPNDPVGWLFRVVRNGASSAARADRRRQRHETGAAAHRPAWFAATENAAIDGTDAAAALETLAIEEREVVVAHLWGGLTFEQIGQLAGVSSSTAHRRYLKALSTLRERLRVPCPNPSTLD
ncbi:MAG TPA: sigma-70 family RNA polymerase sigma factor [Planctomycetales bacterium]|jgi:RNA polymerase sigma-70 factor (ECF subfamily)|nr:sigma-70 family RNA polymerase sigma factor [Planctomycetales bacterium]